MENAQYIPCNLRGSEKADVVYEAGVAQIARIVTCHDCGLMFASPRGQIVDHEDYEQHQPIGLLRGASKDSSHPYYWRYSKESHQVRDFEPTRATLRRLHPLPGRMIEVGSGLGYLLRSFKDEGWDVPGVDPWRERSLRQDGHIYFFTDASLQATYEKAGFRKVEHRHVGRSMTAERFLWNAANIAKSDAVSKSAKKVSDALGLWRLRFSLNLHDMIRIVVEKPAD